MRIVGERWAIIAEIASGGMGTVFEAQHVVTEQRVALKVLHPHLYRDAVHEKRFLREVTAPARIGHENICEVYDAGFDRDGSPYIAMELLDGETLREALERGLSVDVGLDVLDEMLDALVAAHERGFVHRDLKPENVFLTRRHGVKLLDFGIVSEASSSVVTMTGTTMGTPLYMSPEQSVDVKRVGPATDVWAVGVMLYELATGHPPFVGDTANAILIHACTRPHRPVIDIEPHVAPDLATLIDRCLEKDPGLRPSSALELRAHLRQTRSHTSITATIPMQSAAQPRRAHTVSTPAAPATSGDSSAVYGIVGTVLLAIALAAFAISNWSSFSATVQPPPPALPAAAPRYSSVSLPRDATATREDAAVGNASASHEPSEPVRCDVPLPVSRVREVLEPLRAEIRRCHRRSADAPARGSLLLTLNVGRDGAVTHATTSGDFHGGVESCAREAARELRFTPLSGGDCATVVEQFVLTRPSDAATRATPRDELSGADIRGVIQHEQRGLQSCWEVATRGMREAPTVRMDLDLEIGSSGTVTRATARGDGLPGLADCLERHVRRWGFPASGATSRTSFPVVFSGS